MHNLFEGAAPDTIEHVFERRAQESGAGGAACAAPTAASLAPASGDPLAECVVPGLERPRAPAPASGQTVLSEPLRLLSEAVALLRAQDPTGLPGPQALGEAAGLLCELQVLQVLALQRLADVDSRGLYVLDDAPSTQAWVQAQRLGWTAGTCSSPGGWTGTRRSPNGCSPAG